MKNHMRLSLSLAVVITCVALAFAQGTSSIPSRVFTHNAKSEASYDQLKDITTVRLIPMQVYGRPLASSDYAGGDEARFYASFTFPGRTLSAQPERVLFSLISTSEYWKYTDFRKASASVDGKRLKLGPLEHVPSFAVSDEYVSQEIAISLPYQTFLRIANGKKVRIRMGPKEFKLEERHLEALRDLARHTVP